MKNTISYTFVVICLTVAVSAYGQNVTWEALTGFHAGISRDMLETPEGTLLLSGPVSLLGSEGIGLYRLAANAQSLSDVSPSAAAIYALVSAGEGYLLCASGDGVWASTDDGMSWDLRLTAQYGAVSALARLRDGKCYAASARGAFYISENHGWDWDTVTTAMGTMHELYKPVDFIGMNIEGWLVAGSYIGFTGISTDGGHRWVQQVITEDSTRLAYQFGEQRHISRSTGTSISVTNRFIGRQSADWRSFDHTFLLWQQDLSVNAIVDNPDGTLFLGVGAKFSGSRPPEVPQDSAGILVSYDDGLSWKWLLRGLDVQSLLLRDNGDLVASTLIQGNMRIDTGTGMYESMAISYGSVSDILVEKGTLIVAVDSCGINGALRSVDHGQTWQWNSDQEVTRTARAPRLYSIPDFGIIRLGMDEFAISSDLGETWNDRRWKNYVCLAALPDTTAPDTSWILASYVVPDDVREDCYVHLYDEQWSRISYTLQTGMGMIFALQAAGPDRLLAAASTGLYESRDLGSTWTQRFDGCYTTLHRMPAGTLYATGPDVVRYSYDNGAHWSMIPCDFSQADTTVGLDLIARGGVVLMAAGVLPTDNTGRAAPGGGRGIHISRDGASWTTAMEGMPTQEVTAITVDAAGYLYAGTRGCGLFRSSASVLSAGSTASPQPSDIRVTLYPHPVRNRGNILLTVPRQMEARITIRDLLGRMCSVIRTREYSPGSHVLPVDVSSLRRGVYVLSVSYDERVHHERFTVLR